MVKYFVWQWIALGTFILFIDQLNGKSIVDAAEKPRLKIAIVGAGPSGLVSARHAASYGHNVTVYEQSDELGGVWVYTDRVGKNEYGVKIHTAMYKGLR